MDRQLVELFPRSQIKGIIRVDLGQAAVTVMHEGRKASWSLGEKSSAYVGGVYSTSPKAEKWALYFYPVAITLYGVLSPG